MPNDRKRRHKHNTYDDEIKERRRILESERSMVHNSLYDKSSSPKRSRARINQNIPVDKKSDTVNIESITSATDPRSENVNEHEEDEHEEDEHEEDEHEEDEHEEDGHEEDEHEEDEHEEDGHEEDEHKEDEHKKSKEDDHKKSESHSLLKEPKQSKETSFETLESQIEKRIQTNINKESEEYQTFKDFIYSQGYIIGLTYITSDEHIKFITVYNLDTGDNILLHMAPVMTEPFKSGIPISKIKEIGRHSYDPCREYTDNSTNHISPEVSEKLDKEYSLIEVESVKRDILNDIVSSQIFQLERLKQTVHKSSISFAIISKSCISILTDGEIKNYGVKNCTPDHEDERQLFTFCDGEYFIKNINSAVSDIAITNNSISDVLTSAHTSHVRFLQSNAKKILKSIKSVYNSKMKIGEYQKVIRKLKKHIIRIAREEDSLEEQYSDLKHSYSSQNLNKAERDLFRMKRIEHKYSLKKTEKRKYVNLLLKLKEEYNTFLLNSDTAIYSISKMLQRIDTVLDRNGFKESKDDSESEKDSSEDLDSD